MSQGLGQFRPKQKGVGKVASRTFGFKGVDTLPSAAIKLQSSAAFRGSCFKEAVAPLLDVEVAFGRDGHQQCL